MVPPRPPNKRLKLAGGDRFKGSGVLCPWRGTDCRPRPLRRRASRPQLKRDPLGATTSPPPRPHSRWQMSLPLVLTLLPAVVGWAIGIYLQLRAVQQLRTQRSVLRVMAFLLGPFGGP